MNAEFLAPTGTLRAVINLGNPVLARPGADGAPPSGVSVDLAHELARRLGVPLQLVVVDAAAKSVDTVTQQQADVGFFAIDPLRGAGIAFTAPYVLIEGCYLVRQDSPLRSVEDVDAPGRSVAVGAGSAYDLHLTRELKHAVVVRAQGTAAVVPAFLDRGLDAAAGIRQPLEAEAATRGGLRLLPRALHAHPAGHGLPAAPRRGGCGGAGGLCRGDEGQRLRRRCPGPSRRGRSLGRAAATIG